MSSAYSIWDCMSNSKVNGRIHAFSTLNSEVSLDGNLSISRALLDFNLISDCEQLKGLCLFLDRLV